DSSRHVRKDSNNLPSGTTVGARINAARRTRPTSRLSGFTERIAMAAFLSGGLLLLSIIAVSQGRASFFFLRLQSVFAFVRANTTRTSTFRLEIAPESGR